jgi:hypothetical protein
MPFATWADYLCGHDGAEETNVDIENLGASFEHNKEPIDIIRGEEAVLFLGISDDGSTLFIHHITDLGHTRHDPDPQLVALVAIGLPRDCFGSIPSGRDEDDETDFSVPSFARLSSVTIT